MMTLADQYFIKALDRYPHELEETTENLGYALSCEPEHAGANWLMGRACHEYLMNYDRAEEYYLRAMEADTHFTAVHEWYAWLLIDLGRYAEADRLLEFAFRHPGACQVSLHLLMAWRHERCRQYEQALEWLHRAACHAHSSGDMQWIKGEIERLQSKQKMTLPYIYSWR